MKINFALMKIYILHLRKSIFCTCEKQFCTYENQFCTYENQFCTYENLFCTYEIYILHL